MEIEALSGYGSGYGDGSGSGYGYGSGDGSGYGSGYGDGSGSGYGSGDGSGSGSGYGYGSGYGSGDGSGDGSGYGSGSGDGSGSGSGYGYGSGSGYGWHQILLATIPVIDATRLKQAGAKLMFWRSDSTGQACNGGRLSVPATVGQVHTSPGPLRCCEKGTLHATYSPREWSGERTWIVAMYPPFDEQDDKVGSLKREILMECPWKF